MDKQTKVPYSQLLIDLSNRQISFTEENEYVDHFKELKRSLDMQYLLVDKDVIHAKDKLHIAEQRQQLSSILQQQSKCLKDLLKEKKNYLKEKLVSEVEKTNGLKKETQSILSKHETAFSQRKAKYDALPLAQQRQEAENECKQSDIMVNVQSKALEVTKKKLYKFTEVLDQMSRLHTVQMAKVYVLCHQSTKRKLDLAAKLRNQKKELEKLKEQKENIFKEGLKIKSHTAPQALRSKNCKQAFDHLSQPVTSNTSTGMKQSRGLSQRITLDSIPILQLPERQGTPPKMPCLSSFARSSYPFSSFLPKLLTSTFSVFKSNPLRFADNENGNTLKDLGEKEMQSSEESSMKSSFTATKKHNEMSVTATSAKSVELFQSSPMDTESNSNSKLTENTVNTDCDKNRLHESEVQVLDITREEIMEHCNAENAVLNRNEKKDESTINAQENIQESDTQHNELQESSVPIRKWKKISPEYHLKPFSISSASKLNAKQNEKSIYFEQNVSAKSDLQTNCLSIQEKKQQVNNESNERIAEHDVSKEDEKESDGTEIVSKDKALQNTDDCIPCTPLISPTEDSSFSGAALTLSPNSGTDGYQSPDMDRWSPTNNSPKADHSSNQPQATEGMNIFGGTSISSSQGFNLAFDFGSSNTAPSATTIIFGENEGGQQTSKNSDKKDEESNFSFGFQQPIFKMF